MGSHYFLLPLLLVASICVAPQAGAQTLSPCDPEALELRAREAFAHPRPDSAMHAARLWAQAAELHEECAAEAHRQAARAYLAAGVADSALVHVAAAAPDSLRGSAVALIERSPAFEPSMSVEAEAAFVRDARELIEVLSGGGEIAASIASVDDAMLALETLTSMRDATIFLESDEPGFPVEVRRWIHRRSTAILWTPLRADTSVVVPAAAYQFRYTPPGSDERIVVDWPCADGCRVVLPHERRR